MTTERIPAMATIRITKAESLDTSRRPRLRNASTATTQTAFGLSNNDTWMKKAKIKRHAAIDEWSRLNDQEGFRRNSFHILRCIRWCAPSEAALPLLTLQRYAFFRTFPNTILSNFLHYFSHLRPNCDTILAIKKVFRYYYNQFLFSVQPSAFSNKRLK